VAHLGQLTRTNQRASLTKVKGMCYNSRRLALTKEVGFIRACTNQRQREAGRKASLTKVKVREARWKVSLTKGREARWKVSLTKGGFSSGTACTNQRQRGQTAGVTSVTKGRERACTSCGTPGAVNSHKPKAERPDGRCNFSNQRQREGMHFLWHPGAVTQKAAHS